MYPMGTGYLVAIAIIMIFIILQMFPKAHKNRNLIGFIVWAGFVLIIVLCALYLRTF